MSESVNGLTYQEAQEKSLNVKWKTTCCPQGEVCWCRVIEPEEKIFDKDGEEIYIAGSGCVPKIYAERIVELHNKHLLPNIQMQQQYIINMIKAELKLEDEFYKPQDMFHSVWFFPIFSIYIYADCPVRHEVVFPLIENNILRYKGIEKHQDEMMVRYVLSDAEIKNVQPPNDMQCGVGKNNI